MSRGAVELSIGQCVSLACTLEATAPKPGNVHRCADFDDATFADFLVSAVAIGPVIEQSAREAVGRAVLAATQATRQLVTTNTNLGTILLLAPLAAVDRCRPLAEGIASVLRSLTPDDSSAVYEAIRLAGAGGLGKVEQMDVMAPAPANLLDAMSDAADRDLVARQYVNGFEQVLGFVVPQLIDGRRSGWSLSDAIVYAHVRLMARFPDTLIARKCGRRIAQQAAARAAKVLEAGEPEEAKYAAELRELDSWLRGDGHRRNPGTTADLIAAGLFAAFREGRLEPPFR